VLLRRIAIIVLEAQIIEPKSANQIVKQPSWNKYGNESVKDNELAKCTLQKTGKKIYAKNKTNRLF